MGWASGLFPYSEAPEAGSCFAALPEMEGRGWLLLLGSIKAKILLLLGLCFSPISFRRSSCSPNVVCYFPLSLGTKDALGWATRETK